jgi:hypothetical protein
MKADVRFLGEYIVTGAFFWIAQLILCLALFGTDVILTKSGGPPLDVLERLKDYQVSLAALALVFLFFTGLMLEGVMNLGKSRIEMRISRSAWFPRDLCFLHS